MNDTKRIFKIKSRIQAEELITNITEKNPIAKTRLANSYWDDHIRRIKEAKAE